MSLWFPYVTNEKKDVQIDFYCLKKSLFRATDDDKKFEELRLFILLQVKYAHIHFWILWAEKKSMLSYQLKLACNCEVWRKRQCLSMLLTTHPSWKLVICLEIATTSVANRTSIYQIEKVVFQS